MTADTFIKRFYPVAKQVQTETGIFAEAMLAQSALETGWGTHVKGNNFFGIKGKGQMFRTYEISEKPDLKFPVIHKITPFTEDGRTLYRYDIHDYFSRYNSPIESFRHYAQFIKTNPRYANALNQPTPEHYLKEVARAGYATATHYEKTLLKVLQSVTKRL